MTTTGAGDAKVVVDFDHHSRRFATDRLAIFEDLRGRCPVAWSERYGGFWVVTDYDELVRVARDPETFSSDHDTVTPGATLGGILIPPSPNHPIPVEIDPPDHLAYRHVLNPWFSPAAVERYEPRLRELTHDAIDAVIGTGRFDIVMDLANPVPAVFTLEFLGVETTEWRTYAEIIHAVMYTPPETDAYVEARQRFGWVANAVREAMEERKRAPREDLLTVLLETPVDGRRMSDEEVLSIALLIIGGGIDTTTGLFANAAFYLHRNHEARQLLRDEPERIPVACEEFLRHVSPTQALARTAVADVELAGQHVRAGDRLLLCWGSANHDPKEYGDPEQVVLDRFPNRHVAFGIGIHRCLGSNLARMEFRVMMEEMLDRMPDYVVDEAAATQYETVGTVLGWIDMPATFTPGAVRPR